MLEVNVPHNCDKPDMARGVNYKEVRYGFLGLRKRVETTTIYEHNSARFTCPECGAVWRWLTNGSEIGFWICDERPENWVKVGVV